jgi:hypothetical protein
MFKLSKEEADSLRFQIGMSKETGRGGRRYLPYVFTEQGVAMLSSVLNSKRAVHVNIEIMRAFVKLRQMLSSNKELAKRLDELEEKYDAQFKVVFDTIRELMTPPEPKRRSIGFKRGKENG